MTASEAIIVAMTMVTMMHAVTGSLMMTAATVAIVRITTVGNLSNKATRQWSSLERAAPPCTHHNGWFLFMLIWEAGGNWKLNPVSARFLISSMRLLSDADKGLVSLEFAHSKAQAFA